MIIPESEEDGAVAVEGASDRLSSITDQSLERAKRAPPRQWVPTLVQFGPLSGMFCLLLALSSIVASLGILAGSDGQPVRHWEWPVSTYLAIFTAIANLSVRYAVIQGVAVTWWLRAAKGSPLAKMHWDWRAGTSVRGALTAGRYMGILGFGSS